MNKYQEIRDTLQSFDILCCEQKDLFWRAIGHTAMVVRDEAKGVNYVWQSTTLYKDHRGTSLAVLSDWLDQYPGKVFARQLSIPRTIRGMAEVILDHYIKKYRDIPYPNLRTAPGLLYMAKSAIDLPFPCFENKPDRVERQCADRIAHTEQTCGIFIPQLNCSETEPDNMRERMPLHWKIDKFVSPGVVIRPEVQIK